MPPETRRLRQTPRAPALLGIAGLALALAPTAQAQQAPVQVEAASVRQGGGLGPGGWQVRLGAGAAFGPAYPGSRELKALPLPVLEVAYRPDLAFIDSIFLNGRDGLGVVAFRRGPLAIGGSIGFARGRDQDLAGRLRGMGNIEPAVRASAFVRVDLGQFGLSLQSFTALGDQQGSTLALGASVRQPIGPRFMLTGRVELTLADADNMQQWFGVTPQQASRSRFPAYNAGGGLRSVSVNLTGIYRLSDTWSLSASAGVSQLLGSAVDSPITERATQPFGLLGVSYRF